LIFEASGSSGAKCRFEISLGAVALGWLLKWFFGL
jgi:hypothetical protein